MADLVVVRDQPIQLGPAPLGDLSLGLSFSKPGLKLSAGYRWERYFDAIDGGYDEHKSEDRTIHGPHFKLAIGFGG